MLTDVRSRGLILPYPTLHSICCHIHHGHTQVRQFSSNLIMKFYNIFLYDILYVHLSFPLSLSLSLCVSISSSIYVPSFSCHWIVQIEICNLFLLWKRVEIFRVEPTRLGVPSIREMPRFAVRAWQNKILICLSDHCWFQIWINIINIYFHSFSKTYKWVSPAEDVANLNNIWFLFRLRLVY